MLSRDCHSLSGTSHVLFGPIHTRRADASVNGTYCCEWKCSHWVWATSKDLYTNLHARVQCELGLWFVLWFSGVDFLQKAERQWVWAGLRPQRTPVRVEAETFEGKELKVGILSFCWKQKRKTMKPQLQELLRDIQQCQTPWRQRNRIKCFLPLERELIPNRRPGNHCMVVISDKAFLRLFAYPFRVSLIAVRIQCFSFLIIWTVATELKPLPEEASASWTRFTCQSRPVLLE